MGVRQIVVRFSAGLRDFSIISSVQAGTKVPLTDG